MAAYNEPHSANHTLRMLQRAMGKIFDPTSTDVSFQLANEENEVKTVCAHTKLLSAVSPVFEAMFNGNWCEKDVVDIVDSKYEVFSKFVQHIYGNELEINQDNIDGLAYLAKKYDIGELVSKCTEYIDMHLCVDTVIHSLDLMFMYELDGLKEKCEQIISENTEDVLQTDDFLTCEKNTLKTILRLDKIACTEAKMFDACIEWAGRKCQDKNVETNAETLRESLGECFDLIKFKEMKHQELLECIKLHNGELFTKNELYNLLVLSNDNGSPANKRRHILPQLPISSVSPENLFQFNFVNVGLKKFSDKAEQVIRFRTSETMVLKKVNYSKIFVSKNNESIESVRGILTYEMKKNDEIIKTFELDIANGPVHLNNCESVTKKDQIYELKVIYRPKTEEHKKPLYIFEHDLQSQRLNDVNLYIKNDQESQRNNNIKFISGLYFEKQK